MKVKLDFAVQKNAVIWLFLLVLLPVTLVFALTGVLCEYFNFSVGELTRDPAVLNNTHPFVGVFSNLGILMWCAASAITMFSGLFFQRRLKQKETARFFLFAALVTFMLLFDDLFLIHEHFPSYLHLPEEVVFLSYGLTILLFLFCCRYVILSSEFIILFVALFFFGGSMGIDMVLQESQIGFLVEDGLKMIGIAGWLLYFWRTAWQKFTELHL